MAATGILLNYLISFVFIHLSLRPEQKKKARTKFTEDLAPAREKTKKQKTPGNQEDF